MQLFYIGAFIDTNKHKTDFFKTPNEKQNKYTHLNQTASAKSSFD